MSKEKTILESKNLGEFYKYVNNRLTNNVTTGVLEDADGSLVTGDEKKAELLNSYFNSVNTLDDGTLPEFATRVGNNDLLENISFTPDVIYGIIRKLKPKTSCDPDGYSTYFIKQLASALVHPLSVLFESFFSVGGVPTAWKAAIITPLFKKGQSSDPSNYRPVSITSVFGKIMERVIASSMLQHLKQNNLLNDNQHGFLSKKSTLTNLLESVNDWSITLNNRNNVAVAYIDFQRAFDSVTHPKLAHKLKAYGIEGALLEWILNFLSDRKHRTRVANSYSGFAPISSGVVQGSCLGPLLFLLFINDLLDEFNMPVTCKLYADDAKLYTDVTSAIDSANLQNTLDKLYNWSKIWQLNISHHKCCIITIGRSVGLNRITAKTNYRPTLFNYELAASPLSIVKSVSDLGVIIDSQLNFCDQIASVTRKAHQRANLIHRCFLSREKDSLILAYKIYVRPILEYCSNVWSPSLKRDILSIEAVQRRFTKRLPGLSNISYHVRLKLLKLESLEIRRLRSDLILVYKILFGHVYCSVVNYFKLKTGERLKSLRRHSYQLVEPARGSSAIHVFFVNRVIKLWNELPLSINFSSVKQFKASLTVDYLTMKCQVNFS